VIGVKRWRECFQRILLCIVVVSAFPVLAAEVVFPDFALSESILEALGMEAGPIQSEYLEQLTILLAGSKGIADLTGLEACIGLEQLHLHFNQIVDLGPLAGLRLLNNISLNGNHIADISPLAPLYNLTSLAIHSNQISDLQPIASLPLLASLSIGNAIESIEPLANLPNLSRLMIYVLPTADLSPLMQMGNLELLLVSSGRTVAGRIPFDPAVLANCHKLANLRLEGYDLMSISDLASTVPAITELALSYVGIDNLSAIQQFDALARLTLTGVIPNSEATAFSQLELPLYLRSLVLESNEIDDISTIARFSQLTSLSLARNRITDIGALEALDKLTVLDLSFNQITDLAPLRSLVELKSLTLVGVPFDRTEGSDANRLIKELRNRGVNITY
jgi:internalin A